MKKIVSLVVLAVLIVVIVKIAPLACEFLSISRYRGQDTTISVEMGATASDVASELEAAGIIRSRYTFIIKYRLSSAKYGNIYYGDHSITNGMKLDDIIKSLTSSSDGADTVTLVVPEGFSIEMIAKKTEEAGLCTYDEFISAINADDYEYEFIKHIPDGDYKYKLEGFLFPSTYEFFADATAHDVIDKMLAAFQKEYTTYFSTYDNLFTVMTMASIVEREAVIDSERATIAGVIANRISKDMLLQVDATVVYAKSAGLYDMTQVTYSDLEVNSPYNTYKYKGLTPGPICNPGIKSVMAAANPESHSWLFYHTDEVKKDGSHIFTQTFDDHISTMN